jgi:hypothetical protein
MRRNSDQVRPNSCGHPTFRNSPVLAGKIGSLFSVALGLGRFPLPVEEEVEAAIPLPQPGDRWIATQLDGVEWCWATPSSPQGPPASQATPGSPLRLDLCRLVHKADSLRRQLVHRLRLGVPFLLPRIVGTIRQRNTIRIRYRSWKTSLLEVRPLRSFQACQAHLVAWLELRTKQ